MKFLKDLNPRQRAEAFTALADAMTPHASLPANAEKQEAVHGFEPPPFEVYAQLITHGRTVAGQHWSLAIPLAEKLAAEIEVTAAAPVLDFESLVREVGEPLAQFVARLAGFRPYDCPHRGSIWGPRGEKPPRAAKGLVVDADWVAKAFGGLGGK